MAFCTAEDVATRLGRTFTTAQSDSAELLCEAATATIADAAGKDDDWSDALDPVPRILRHLAIELVCRTMRNPDGLARFQEQLGAYAHSESYRDAARGGGMQLTEVEHLLVSRTVWGRTSASVRPESTATELHDVIYGECS